MKTKISMTPWKKQRFPRKLKKTQKKLGRYWLSQKLITIANFGRYQAYELNKYYYEKKNKQ